MCGSASTLRGNLQQEAQAATAEIDSKPEGSEPTEPEQKIVRSDLVRSVVVKLAIASLMLDHDDRPAKYRNVEPRPLSLCDVQDHLGCAIRMSASIVLAISFSPRPHRSSPLSFNFMPSRSLLSPCAHVPGGGPQISGRVRCLRNFVGWTGLGVRVARGADQ